MTLRNVAIPGLSIAFVAGGLGCSGPTPKDDVARGGDDTGVGAAMGTSSVTSGSASGGTSSGVTATTTGTVGGITSGTEGSGGAGPTTTSAGTGGFGGLGTTLGAGGSAGAAGGSVGGAGGSGVAGGASSGGLAGSGGSTSERPRRVLLYSFSTLDIPSVPAQLDIFEEHLSAWSYEVERSNDPSVFSDASLAEYAAVGMINTCFSPFGADNPTGESEAQALQRFLQAGGGLFGTHCAEVTFQSANPPALYNQVLGGRAGSSNFEGQSECRRTSEHPTTLGLPETFTYNGNLDATDFLAEDIEILVRCTWGNPGATDAVVSWVRHEGQGRVFFTNFAKVDADLVNVTLGEPHILAGLAWVLGQGSGLVFE